MCLVRGAVSVVELSNLISFVNMVFSINLLVAFNDERASSIECELPARFKFMLPGEARNHNNSSGGRLVLLVC